MYLHHDCMRGLVAQHKGYVSHTEGDVSALNDCPRMLPSTSCEGCLHGICIILRIIMC